MGKKREYISGARMSGKAQAMRLEAEFYAAVLGETVVIVSPDGQERLEPAPKQLPQRAKAGGSEPST